jgi:hypothetical protein
MHPFMLQEVAQQPGTTTHIRRLVADAWLL